MPNVPKIEPIKTKEYEVKQSKYEEIPKLPMRSMIVGPSGSGKTILLQNTILDIYKGCFARIYIWSPSIDIDQTWQPVKDYIEKEIKPYKEEQIYFDHYNPADLERVIDTQYKVVDYMKSNNHKKIYQILIIIDDFADDTAFTRQSKLLHQLYIRGRHQMISTITATQVYKQISPVIRKNITDLMIYRLRNYADLEAILEEMSAVYDKKVLMKLYKIATDPPYSFLYINLTAKEKTNMFYMRFTHKLIPKENV